MDDFTPDELWAVAKVAYALDDDDGQTLWRSLNPEEQAIAYRLRQGYQNSTATELSEGDREAIRRLATKLVAMRDGIQDNQTPIADENGVDYP